MFGKINGMKIYDQDNYDYSLALWFIISRGFDTRLIA